MSDDHGRKEYLGASNGTPETGGSSGRYVLTVNGGSSSLKFAVFAATDPFERALSVRIERGGLGGARLISRDAGGVRREDREEGLGFLGVDIDDGRNAAGGPLISTPSSPARVRVIRTDEEIVIARETVRLGVGPSIESLPKEPTAVISQGAD